MTRRWARLRWPSLAARQPAPWRRNTSATSRRGRDIGGWSARRRHLDVEVFERTLDLPDHVDRHAGVPGRRHDVAVAEQVLDYVDVDAMLQQMRGEAVPQGVNGDRLVEPRRLDGFATGPLHRARRHRMRRISSGEEPLRRSPAPPVIAQDRE